MYQVIVILPILSVVVATPVKSVTNLGIFGGHDTDISKHPWQISVLYRGAPVCGGFLIAPNWAVTSGECLNGLGDFNSSLSIRAGSTQSHHSPIGEIVHISRAITHPDFTSDTFDNDIALLELISDVTVQTAKPVKLPEAHQAIPDGIIVTLTGWGINENFTFPINLQETQLPTINRETCRKQYVNSLIYVTDNKFCASERGKGSCLMDYGNPVTYDDVAIGIVSVSLGCGEAEHPDVYTQVSKYVSWIKSITGI